MGAAFSGLETYELTYGYRCYEAYVRNSSGSPVQDLMVHLIKSFTIKLQNIISVTLHSL